MWRATQVGFYTATGVLAWEAFKQGIPADAFLGFLLSNPVYVAASLLSAGLSVGPPLLGWFVESRYRRTAERVNEVLESTLLDNRTSLVVREYAALALAQMPTDEAQKTLHLAFALTRSRSQNTELYMVLTKALFVAGEIPTALVDYLRDANAEHRSPTTRTAASNALEILAVLQRQANLRQRGDEAARMSLDDAKLLADEVIHLYSAVKTDIPKPKLDDELLRAKEAHDAGVL